MLFFALSQGPQDCFLCSLLPQTYPPFSPFANAMGSSGIQAAIQAVFVEPSRITHDEGLWVAYQRADVLGLCE